jgi:hypothetical protein
VTDLQKTAALAWVAQGRCAACHIRLSTDASCASCGSTWRTGRDSTGTPWLQERSWMRCATWFIHGGWADLALDLLERPNL